MKKILVFLMAMLLPVTSFAQKDDAKKLTKFEEFSSKTGSIVKFVDSKLPNIPKSFMGSLETGIRTFKGGQNAYFYRIEETETSRSVDHIAMIEYSDLVEMNKALLKLASEVDSDCAENPDYLENKFRTTDGFEVGYFISKGKVSWFLKLERYTSSTVFIRSKEALVKAFQDAQGKIEELKAAGK